MPKTNLIKGQSLIEILIAIGISSLLVGSVVSTYVVSLSSNANARLQAVGGQLGQETFDNTKAVSEANWHSIYDTSKGSDYYLSLSGQTFGLVLGTEDIPIDNVSYTRSLVIENVQRGAGGDIVTVGGTDDPSTQKITVTVSWPSPRGGTAMTKMSGYVSRNKNVSLKLTNWESGPGVEGPFIGQSAGFSASTNVDYGTLPGVIKLLNF